MNNNVKQIVRWILTQSDAPSEIKDRAWEAVDDQEPRVQIHDLEVRVSVYKECKDLVNQGKKIMAIKTLRQATGCTLVEGKDAVVGEFEVEYQNFVQSQKNRVAEYQNSDEQNPS